MTCLAAPAARRRTLRRRFGLVRQASEAMCSSLSPEEYRIQPCEEVSPPWWNLAHTSWFFVRNVLQPFGGQSVPEDDLYDRLLNSYYASLGPRLARGSRGFLTRPTTEEVYAFRTSVDSRVERLLEEIADEHFDRFAAVVEIGLQHELQHQELFYTEIKYILARNPPPLRRAFVACGRSEDTSRPHLEFTLHDGGLFDFGHQDSGWCWDNELPVHSYYLESFRLANRLVTCGEYLAFMQDGGYSKQLLWLDSGWQERCARQWRAPLYWEDTGGAWQLWTLAGMRPLSPAEPVCHVSFYEADAYARWRGLRLPSEREWEHAARRSTESLAGSGFVASGHLHPQAGGDEMHGCLWQWTSSYYEPYPGYRPFSGALAEYNGKFMDNQRVLRGGSCVTPRDHYRLSYRNFWPAVTRFQFTGIRLADDMGD